MTVAGKVTNKELAADNRQASVYDESFNADKDNTTVLEISATYKLIKTPRLQLIPGVVFIINQDFLFLIDDRNKSMGLNSTDKTKWKGPFINFAGSYKASDLLRPIS